MPLPRLRDLWRKDALHAESVRFLLAGGINTAFSYCLYLFLLLVFNPQLSLSAELFAFGDTAKEARALAPYTLAYVISACTSYLLHLKLTFRARHSAGKLARAMPVLLMDYVAGAGILKTAQWAGVPPALAPIFVWLIWVPVKFFCLRHFLKRGD